jgi:hypothetical protein
LPKKENTDVENKSSTWHVEFPVIECTFMEEKNVLYILPQFPRHTMYRRGRIKCPGYWTGVSKFPTFLQINGSPHYMAISRAYGALNW